MSFLVLSLFCGLEQAAKEPALKGQQLKWLRGVRALTDGQSREVSFQVAAELLVEMGLMTNLDVAFLVSYCVGFAHLTEATNAPKRYGLMMKSPMQSRYLAVLN